MDVQMPYTIAGAGTRIGKTWSLSGKEKRQTQLQRTTLSKSRRWRPVPPTTQAPGPSRNPMMLVAALSGCSRKN
eukprot:2494672-Rhodomonas_salina.1